MGREIGGGHGLTLELDNFSRGFHGNSCFSKISVYSRELDSMSHFSKQGFLTSEEI